MKVGIYLQKQTIHIIFMYNETRKYAIKKCDEKQTYEFNLPYIICQLNNIIEDIIKKNNHSIDELRLIMPSTYGIGEKSYIYANLSKDRISEVIFINEFYFLLSCVDNIVQKNSVIVYNIKREKIMAATIEWNGEKKVLNGFFGLKHYSKKSNLCSNSNMSRFLDRIECVAEELDRENYVSVLDCICLYCEDERYTEIASKKLASIYEENIEYISSDDLKDALINIFDLNSKNTEICVEAIGCLVNDKDEGGIVNLSIIEKYTELPCKTTFKLSRLNASVSVAYCYITEGTKENINDVKVVGKFKVIFDDENEMDTEITISIDKNMEIDICANNLTVEKTMFDKVDVVTDVNLIESDSLLYNEGMFYSFIEKEFEKLVGMDKIKSYLYEFYQLEIYNQKRNRVLGIDIESNSAYNFVLYGNPGTGKTTVARIISKILCKLGIRRSENVIEVDRTDLVGTYVGQTEEKTSELIEMVKEEGATLFIDEAYTLYKENSQNDYGIEAINCILKDMEDNIGEYSVIIAGYKKPMKEMLKKANPGFSSRFNFHIELDDYSEAELLLIAQKMANSKNYIIEEEALDVIREKCIKEKIDDTFSNARFIRILLEEAIRKMSLRVMKIKNPTKEDYTFIKAEDIETQYKQQKISDLLDELNSYVGLKSAKSEINKIISQIEFNKLAKEKNIRIDNGFESLHMIFKGNPGTGKTSVARIISKIYGQLGILKRPDVFVECTRADLVGEFQGSTALKTKKKVNEALGGVLFIDEAYSLCINNNDTYGKEAIDTLVAEMENNRDKLMVVFAGYAQEMEKFLEINQGLKSRIKNCILFEDYDIEELYQIFRSMVEKKGFLLQDNLDLVVRQELYEKKKDKDFGNARGVRNLVDCYIQRLSERICMIGENTDELDNTQINLITKQDIIGE